MRLKGGIFGGSVASLYGMVTYTCLLLGMNQHDTMKTVCYVLAAIGILLGVYWLATREIMGIPVLLVGVTHIGLGARADHVGMQVGCTGLAVVVFVIGALMLAQVTAREE